MDKDQSSSELNATLEQKSAQQGWECPRCGAINAPWRPNCSCAPPTYFPYYYPYYPLWPYPYITCTAGGTFMETGNETK